MNAAPGLQRYFQRESLAVAAFILAVNLALFGKMILTPGLVILRDPALEPTVRSSLNLWFPQWDWQGQYGLASGQSGMIAPVLYLPLVLWHVAGGSVDLFSRWMPFFAAVSGCLGLDRLLRIHYPYITLSGRLFGVFLFLTSPWLADRFGYWYIWLGFMILPWALALLEEGVMAWQPRTLFWAGVILGAAGNVITVFAGTLAAAVLLIHETRAVGTPPRERARYAVYAVAGVTLASLYWLAPLLASLVFQPGYVDRSLFMVTTGSLMGHYSWPYYLIGANAWWPHVNPNGYGPMHYLWPLAIAIFLVLLLVHFMAGAWGNRPGAGFWIFLASSFIAVWPIGPFQKAYNYLLYAPLPLHTFVHSLFRSPAKISGGVVFAYPLMGVSLWYGYSRLSGPGPRLVLRAVLLVLWGIIALPGVISGFYDVYVPVVPPAALYHLYDRAASLPFFGRVNTVFVTAPLEDQAYDSRFGYTQFKWAGGKAYTTGFESQGWPGIVLNQQSTAGKSVVAALTDAMARGDTATVLALARGRGIGYIVVHDDVIANRPFPALFPGLVPVWREGDFAVYAVPGVTSLAGPLTVRPLWYGFVVTGPAVAAETGIPDFGGWYPSPNLRFGGAGQWTTLRKTDTRPATAYYLPTCAETAVFGAYLLLALGGTAQAWMKRRQKETYQ